VEGIHTVSGLFGDNCLSEQLYAALELLYVAGVELVSAFHIAACPQRRSDALIDEDLDRLGNYGVENKGVGKGRHRADRLIEAVHAEGGVADFDFTVDVEIDYFVEVLFRRMPGRMIERSALSMANRGDALWSLLRVFFASSAASIVAALMP
jgi:hypothetical protein